MGICEVVEYVCEVVFDDGGECGGGDCGGGGLLSLCLENGGGKEGIGEGEGGEGGGKDVGGWGEGRCRWGGIDD